MAFGNAGWTAYSIGRWLVDRGHLNSKGMPVTSNNARGVDELCSVPPRLIRWAARDLAAGVTAASHQKQPSRNENHCPSCHPEKFAPLHVAHHFSHEGLTRLPTHASTPIDPSPTNDNGARSGGASILIPPLSPGRSTHAVS